MKARRPFKAYGGNPGKEWKQLLLVGSSRDGKNWVNSQYNRKDWPTEFPARLKIECERKKGVKSDSEFFYMSGKNIELSAIETEDTASLWACRWGFQFAVSISHAHGDME